jgi:mRNA-capping enzyme
MPEKIGYLYVTGYEPPFSSMKVTKAISGLNNKIIECRWFENRWDFMRERVDKSYPNHLNTAMGKLAFFVLVLVLLSR